MNYVAQPDAVERAFDAVCDRLHGFDDTVSAEWIDGYFTALLTGPRVVPFEEWVQPLLGDAFGRTFADPSDADEARRALMGRWKRVAEALDAEDIAAEPDAMHLAPLMAEWDEAARAEVVASGDMTAEDVEQALHTGNLWACGYLQAVEDFADDWPGADEGEVADRLAVVQRLTEPPAAADEDRDQLIEDACSAIQELRLYWAQNAPAMKPRRVEIEPGRNEPCPCGSGKKYKKCHGAG